jgi:transposase
MKKSIMIGCDLHDATMVLRVAEGAGESIRKVFPTCERTELIQWLREFAAQREAERIIFAYEASAQGFGLCDALREAGIECHVLAPTHLPHSSHSRKNKNDDKDAMMLLEEVRAHVLAGRPLPTVWIPDLGTRDDREVIRLRLEAAAQRTRIKNQIRNVLKRWQMALPTFFTKTGDWSKRTLRWLEDLAAGRTEGLREGAQEALSSLIALYRTLTEQIRQLDRGVLRLSKSPRYAQAFRKLQLLHGVGTLTAMTFLTELGDLGRFANRRQLAAYLGLAPASFESGKRDDRKGHITRQGPSRVRHVLCQAVWASLRHSQEWRQIYDRIKGESKSRSKVAIVAVMRKLAVTMWQVARSEKWDEVLKERDKVLDEQRLGNVRRTKTSARAQQTGPVPSSPLSPRPGKVKAEARARRTGLTRTRMPKAVTA